MAGRNEIEYRVDVDASGARRGLTEFSRAAQKAGKDAAKSLDDTATAGDKARTALTQMATAMDAELREAAAAADALKTALGEAADKFDANQVVADLNRMGVTFDEIRGDADKFALTLREIDGIRVGQLNAGLGKTKTALDNVRSSSDQSRSVMANLSGNAAQSAFQNLGGNIGDVGVAIGQLAEYAVDGNVKIGNIVKLAGPMLGLAAATTVLTQAIGAIKAEDAFNAQLVDDFSEALRDGNTIAETLLGTIRDTGDLNFETGLFGGGGILGISSKTRDLIPLFNQLGLNYEDFVRLLSDPTGVQQLKDMKEEFLDLALAADTDAAGDAFQDQAIAARDAAQGLEDYKNSTDAALLSQEELDTFLQGTALTQGEITGAMSKQTVAVGRAEVLWKRLLKDLKDGRADTDKATSAWNTLRDELGLSDQAMAELVQQKLDEQLADDAAAAEELAGQIVAVRDAIAEYNRVVGSADFGAAAFEGATVAAADYFESGLADEKRIVDQAAAFDELATAVEETGGRFMDFNSPEGRQAFGALESLGQTLIPDVAQAFDDADGDLDQFKRNMHAVGERTISGLVSSFVELGDSEEEARDKANDLMIQLGLVPENMETVYDLAGTEEAKLQLDLLQGYIAAIPADVQTTITQQVLAGDYVGAVATVQAYADAHPATLYVDADVSRALEAIRRVREALAAAQVASIVLGVSSQSATTSTAPTSAAARSVAVAPAAVAGPVNVHVHAAVVGNRYDVERVVSGAVRNSIRLAGRRQLAVTR